MDNRVLINVDISLLTEEYFRESQGQNNKHFDTGYNYFNDLLTKKLDNMSKSEIRGCVNHILTLCTAEVGGILADYSRGGEEDKWRDSFYNAKLHALQTVLELAERKYRNCDRVSLRDRNIEGTIDEVFRQSVELKSCSSWVKPIQTSVWNKIRTLAGTKLKNGQIESERFFKTLPYKNSSFAESVKRQAQKFGDCEQLMDSIVMTKGIPQEMQGKMCMLLERQKKFSNREREVANTWCAYSQNPDNDPFVFLNNSNMLPAESVTEAEEIQTNR